jgi:hypothetical protein
MGLMLEFTDETAPHQIAFELYGAAAVVCTNSREVLDQIEPLLPPGWRPCAREAATDRLGLLREEDGTYSVYLGVRRVSEGQGLKLSLVLLDGQIRGHIALYSPHMTFIHAGAVAHDGVAMIFPGQSFSGKTALVSALVRAGAIYFSDEFAVIDEDGLVHPYAKPLSLRSEAGTSQVEHHVSELGGVAGDEARPLGVAVVTSYSPGAEWNPRRLTPGEAALAVLAHAVPARERPKETMQAITRMVENAVVLEGERGEADELADELLGLVRT